MGLHQDFARAPLPPDEPARLRALERYRLTGLGTEPAFDTVARFAAACFDVPIAVVSIIDADTQCFRGAMGLDELSTPRDWAFCSFTILGDAVMVVEDAHADPRFAGNPMVTGAPGVRFYAGAPLTVASGETVGSLCLVDTVPRAFGAKEREHLRLLAQSVVDIIELRLAALSVDDARRSADEQRDLLQLTVNNVVEGVALVDGKLRMMLWNDAFLDMFGYAPNEVQHGMDARALMLKTARRGDLGPGQPDVIVRDFVESLRSSDSRRIAIQRSDGRILDVWRKSIRGGNFIMTARDVTEERQIARLKDELVSTVSHELRTPLTSITGSLALIASGAAGALPDKAAGLVDIARRNGDRLRLLVDDLLDIDKLQSGKSEFSFAPVDLGELVREAAAQNAPFAERFGVTLAAAVPADPVLVSGDRNRLLQVLANLLSNAAKFSPRDSAVRIALTVAERAAHIRVIDQGPGISPAFRAKLFSRFSQEYASSDRQHSGTGLGLAITKEIVERHGGGIALDTDAAADARGGASFRVTLPLLDPADAPA